MTTLTQAIERKQWEMAALLLALGVSRVLAKLPRGAAEDLLSVLESAYE